MAQLRPKNITEFANLSGVNEYKAQQYGDRFISEILEFERTAPITSKPAVQKPNGYPTAPSAGIEHCRNS